MSGAGTEDSGEPGSTPQPWAGNESRLLAGVNARNRRLLVGVGSLPVVALCWVVAGVSGVLTGLVVAALWYGLGAPYAVAAGAVLLAAFTPEVGTPLPYALAGVALLVPVLVPVLAAPDPRQGVAWTVAVAVAVGTLSWLLVTAAPIWLAAGGLLGVLAIAAYALYRYYLLRVGLLDGGTQNGDGEPTEPT